MPETLLTLFVGKKNLEAEVVTFFYKSETRWNFPICIALRHVCIRVH